MSTSGYDPEALDVGQRVKRVNDILGDQTLFPIEFRNWLKMFIEQSGITLPFSSIQGVPPPPVDAPIFELPAGTIVGYGSLNYVGNTGLICNGQSVLRADFAELFAVIGTTYGSVSGTTFNVPDLRDRAPYGSGSKVTMGSSEGGALGTRGPRHFHTFSGNTGNAGGHSHSVTDPSHGHSVSGGTDGFFSGGGFGSGSSGNTLALIIVNGAVTGISIVAVGDHAHTVSGSTTGAGVVDAPGYLGITFIIITGKKSA